MFSDLNMLFDNMKTLMLRESNAQLVKKQAELDALQSQINPHFLYNTLESIRGQAIEYGMKDIEIMTRSLSKLFRYLSLIHICTSTTQSFGRFVISPVFFTFRFARNGFPV